MAQHFVASPILGGRGKLPAMKSFQAPVERRSFLKLFGAALGAFLVPGAWRGVLAAPAAAVPANDPVALAIGYVAGPSKIRVKGQNCSGCALYTAVDSQWGRCQMLTTGLVSSQGWCRSWSKK